MEEKMERQLIPNDKEGRGGLDGEEYYEKIEAPWFVDFTAPDHQRPNDRCWFCLRMALSNDSPLLVRFFQSSPSLQRRLQLHTAVQRFFLASW